MNPKQFSYSSTQILLSMSKCFPGNASYLTQEYFGMHTAAKEQSTNLLIGRWATTPPPPHTPLGCQTRMARTGMIFQSVWQFMAQMAIKEFTCSLNTFHIQLALLAWILTSLVCNLHSFKCSFSPFVFIYLFALKMIVCNLFIYQLNSSEPTMRH